ncbi:heavy-metal-associated domain-containing protein [Cellulophaga sp. Hel_I_12]|uniref:heavy-metal-associated domain-containing protein n=1 Tax=Cellulophaga sp. Hel_I_12 TaxID=1249972 RepID=UPI000645E920|nr:heavy metal-associated domain-containing protein [Cellulophaga sp. Hel_I_12]
MQNSIIVQNLKCGGCAKTISSKITAIPNITGINVNIETATISFTSDSAESTLKVKEKLKQIGYPAIDEENSLTSKAKSFVSCATGKMS